MFAWKVYPSIIRDCNAPQSNLIRDCAVFQEFYDIHFIGQIGSLKSEARRVNYKNVCQFIHLTAILCGMLIVTNK